MSTENQKQKLANKGFTLVELLIVTLLIGILCQAGVSAYGNLVGDTAIETLSGEIKAFFDACRKNAKFRHNSLTIVFNAPNSLAVAEDESIYLRLDNIKDMQFPKQAFFSDSGEFVVNGRPTENIDLSVKIVGGKVATLSLKL